MRGATSPVARKQTRQIVDLSSARSRASNSFVGYQTKLGNGMGEIDSRAGHRQQFGLGDTSRLLDIGFPLRLPHPRFGLR